VGAKKNSRREKKGSSGKNGDDNLGQPHDQGVTWGKKLRTQAPGVKRNSRNIVSQEEEVEGDGVRGIK